LSSGIERRRYVRFQVPVKIQVRGHGLDETCLTVEVGLGGCGVTLSRRIREGALVQVELSSTRTAQVVSGTAEVIWNSPALPWRTGFSFSPALVVAMGPFLRGLVGDVPLWTKLGQGG
jgi:hypothetical protein